MNGAGRGTLPPGDPHHFQLSRRYAFSNADLIVIVGTPVRLPHGLRQAPLARRDGRPDRPRLPHRRQEPRHRPRHRRRRRPRPRSRHPGRVGPDQRRRRRAQGVAGGAARAEQTRLEKRLPQLLSDASPDPPVPAGAARSTTSSPRTRIYIGDGGDIVTFSGQVVQPKSPGHWMDPGPLGTLGVGVPFVLAAKQARPDKEVVAPLRRRRVLASPAGTSRRWSASTCPSSASSATTPR